MKKCGLNVTKIVMDVTTAPVPQLLITTDKQVKFLYNKIDSVLTYKHDKYFPLTLDQMLQQTLKKKQQWVLCWRMGICNSKKRAKKEVANKTLPIWKYFTKEKKPDSPPKHNRHNKRDRRTKRANKKLFDQHILAIVPIVAANRSDSCPPALQPLRHPNVEQPSVLNHFD